MSSETKKRLRVNNDIKKNINKPLKFYDIINNPNYLIKTMKNHLKPI